MSLSKLTQELMLHVDLTPNDGLPLRILRAYRQNCDCNWSDNTSNEKTKNPLLIMMNEHNTQRAEILDKAISKLEEG